MNILVDSNIVIYSLTQKSPKKKIAQKFLRENKDILCVSHQAILESIRVLTHPKYKFPMSSHMAVNSVWKIADALDMISPNLNTISLTKELIKKYKLKSNRVFDTYLVATALSNSVEIIATDNTKHFKIYKEIKILYPFK